MMVNDQWIDVVQEEPGFFLRSPVSHQISTLTSFEDILSVLPSTFVPNTIKLARMDLQEDIRELEAIKNEISQEEPETLAPQDMLSQLQDINVLAPLVRHSKLPFRHLVSQYDVHITHTPMILAAEFARNGTARESDFSTSTEERGTFLLSERSNPSVFVNVPEEESSCLEEEVQRLKKKRKVKGAVIAQFAANDAKILADACELINPYVDGIDLNCGCPQKWAYQEKIGSYLLRQPETVRDLVRAAKDRLGWGFPVSVKIRVDSDLQLTHKLIETAISSGISHLQIHGRTRLQPSTVPPDLPAIKFACEVASRHGISCVGNGDIWTEEDAKIMRRETGVRGVMGARGLLANPALFSGYDKTPQEAVESFLNISTSYGFIYPLFHRHLSMMLESHFSRPERVYFNQLGSHAAVFDHLASRGVGVGLEPCSSRADPEIGVGRGIVRGWDGVMI